MSSRQTKIFIIIFGIVWVGGLSALAFLMLFVWSVPFLVALIPLGMVIAGLFLSGFMYTNSDPRVQLRKAMAMQRQFQQDFLEIAGEELHDAQSPYHQRGDPYVYQLPTKCTECNASISTEDVDWVGPLQARCPYCHATIEARRRRL